MKGISWFSNREAYKQTFTSQEHRWMAGEYVRMIDGSHTFIPAIEHGEVVTFDSKEKAIEWINQKVRSYVRRSNIDPRLSYSVTKAKYVTNDYCYSAKIWYTTPREFNRTAVWQAVRYTVQHPNFRE